MQFSITKYFKYVSTGQDVTDAILLKETVRSEIELRKIININY